MKNIKEFLEENKTASAYSCGLMLPKDYDCFLFLKFILKDTVKNIIGEEDIEVHWYTDTIRFVTDDYEVRFPTQVGLKKIILIDKKVRVARDNKRRFNDPYHEKTLEKLVKYRENPTNKNLLDYINHESEEVSLLELLINKRKCEKRASQERFSEYKSAVYAGKKASAKYEQALKENEEFIEHAKEVLKEFEEIGYKIIFA